MDLLVPCALLVFKHTKKVIVRCYESWTIAVITEGLEDFKVPCRDETDKPTRLKPSAAIPTALLVLS